MIKKEIAYQIRRCVSEIEPERKEKTGPESLYPWIEFPDGERMDVRVRLAEALRADNHLAQPATEQVVGRFSELFRKKFGTIEVGTAGEIQLGFSAAWLRRQLSKILLAGPAYGRSEGGKNTKVAVQCFSPDMFRPLGLKDLRCAWVGDTLSSILSTQGYRVRREWYVRDLDREIDRLTESVLRRYWQAQGFQVDYPDRFLPGQYVIDLAAGLRIADLKLKDVDRMRKSVRLQLVETMFSQFEQTTRERFRVHFHMAFRASWLQQRGWVKELVALLNERGWVSKQPGQTWLKAPELADSPGVLIESDRRPTAVGLELAYWYQLWTERKFQRQISIHSPEGNTVDPACETIRQILLPAFSQSKVLVQPIRYRAGEGEGLALTDSLDSFLDSLGYEAARFLVLSQPAEQGIEVSTRQTGAAPDAVYKSVQYAYEQMCSILQRKDVRYAKSVHGPEAPMEHSAERALLSRCVQFPDLLEDISRTLDVSRLPRYAWQLGEAFQDFTRQCPLFGQRGLLQSRLELIKASRQIMSQSLKLMGLTGQPESKTKTN